jgi:glycolate oxidase
MADMIERLVELVGGDAVVAGDAISDDYAHDEALGAVPHLPDVVVRPSSVDDVAAVVRLAAELGVPVTARGSGTGLSGACIPRHGGILVSFERMTRIVEIDTDNHMAVVQPGVTLEQLDAETAAHGLVYPVFPGESSASLGGNVATNAGGMRAVKYGVTRHQVLGVEAVLGTGDVIRCGGKYVKSTSGYDLTQLIIGSEGTLAIVTEAILRLYPRAQHSATVLAPFSTMAGVAGAVPRIVGSGVGPMILEYIDVVAMVGIERTSGHELGIPDAIKAATVAYLVVVLENRSSDRLDEDTAELAEMLDELGALDVYVLPSQAGAALIAAREKAFWGAKAAGAHDIIDMVVPRASIPAYLAKVGELASSSGSFIVGCGHAGDGNVHLSIFQGDDGVRSQVLHELFAAGVEMGGAISGEHGIGSQKKGYFMDLEDPTKLALMARIKTAFDPHGILNPGAIWDQALVSESAELR